MIERRLILVFVAFRTPAHHVDLLLRCLSTLAPTIGYAVIVNDSQAEEPIHRLAPESDAFITLPSNLGYGRAANYAVHVLTQLASSAGVAMPPWLAVLNTDLCWQSGSFEAMLNWLEERPDVVLAVPQITNSAGETQQLCKRDPTVLALFSRRFWPFRFKPRWLRRIDDQFSMRDVDLSNPFDVDYLSGCCMFIRRSAFDEVGGFDARYFLYLEDADISRSLRNLGRCMHAPVMRVVHDWGRGNYKSIRLMLVNLHSAFLYFQKWGWRWF